jgi:hypothetical protein
MKNGVLSICFVLSCLVNYAQGLENVIVERYYISDANDTALNSVGGRLPVGSVTYRIFVDMLPGYKFQAVYGVPGAPGFPDHNLILSTTTSFFNNEDRGSTTPDNFTKSQAKNNTVMLDSWFSVGGACSDAFGVLKSADDSIAGGATVINSDGILHNADVLAGIPLTVQDGIYKMASQNPGTPNLLGFTAGELQVFNSTSQAGNIISTNNASWSMLGGTYGYPDSIANRVLVAQVTTDGVFSFELNIQLGTPTPGGIENYVANNPIGNEIMMACLTYNSLVSTGYYPKASSSVFSIYPNPSNDIVTLEIPESQQSHDCSYSIYNAMGEKILHKELGIMKAGSREKIDLSTQNRGLYIVELLTGDVSSSKKIILN